MKRNITLLLALSATAFYACNNTDKKVVETADTISLEKPAANAPAAEITVTPVTNSPEFPDAKLSMKLPAAKGAFKAGDSLQFDYTVTNFTLGSQTPDAGSKMCNNSAKGQHIHLILNNAPYEAYYDSKFRRKMDSAHYIALSFLSRSYHESIKTKDAYVLREIGTPDKSRPFDMKAPHLFYSRPKGEYTGNDTKKVLLDFYLVNTRLGKDGNKVCATINGKEFMLDTWQPYFIEGLPMGENTIRLELLDNKGGKIAGPFNSVTRTITLKAEAAK
jgi:hypothetical protein